MNPPTISLKPGANHIDRTCRVRAPDGAFPARAGTSAVKITGDDLEVDFQGVRLMGCPDARVGLERHQGVGIEASGCSNLTIRNACVSGYHTNLRAVDCPRIRLVDCDFSHSGAQALDRADVWLEIRDLDMWRTYGSGAWLERCHHARVERVAAHGAQNGLILVNCSGVAVHQCDFQYNSGWGLAMWGCMRGLVSWNRVDFVNRPWRAGWGGDSAGLVMVAGCHENLVVSNSLTHGGDGLFLTDQTNGGTNAAGSCDRNLFAFNDGSHSPNNAFEATFSSGNVFFRNYANHSRFGFWLGFSRETWVIENEIGRNALDGIAVEHGQRNQAILNVLRANGRSGIHLFAPRADERSEHPSVDSILAKNSIVGSRQPILIEDTTDALLFDNDLDVVPEVPPEALKSTHRPESHLAQYDNDAWVHRVLEIQHQKPKEFHMHASTAGPHGAAWLRMGTYAPQDPRGQPAVWKPCATGVEIWLLDSSLARYAISASEGVDLERPRVGEAFVAAGSGTVRIRHQGVSQEIPIGTTMGPTR